MAIEPGFMPIKIMKAHVTEFFVPDTELNKYFTWIVFNLMDCI